jgi:hypothetical protein
VINRVVVVLVLVAVLAPSAATAREDIRAPLAFRTVNTKFYCDTQRLATFALTCWRAWDGMVFWMYPKGRAHRTTIRLYKRFYNDSAPILRAGKSWNGNVISCRNRKGAGLRCVNGSGHGWVLGPVKAFDIF